ncbi:type III secretion system export control protein [Xanthomonas graminis]|uniref:type III secretion system export control protein n=1 Tax=Xanthomonas graminis TaxID=3390026 RepID=UPI001F424959|nr:type III secretion system export control protein [Xanthomonas translucens]UKE74431.1 type III secretion system export control protein [Xanthomonas translucens pv. phleipratensis]
MIKPRFGRITRSGTQIASADGTPTECPASDAHAHAQESGESESLWSGAVASAARFPPSWRKRRRLVGGRHVEEEGELPEPPSLALETERDAEAASLKVHAGAQQQPNQESDQHHHSGGGTAHDATPAAAPSSPSSPSSEAGDAPVPAAAAHLSQSDAAFEQILHGYRSAAGDQAQQAMTHALVEVRERVLDRSLAMSFNIANWILLREHLAKTASATATQAQSLEQVRTQLTELVTRTPNMPERAVQTLHALLPLLVLHAGRPRHAGHRQRAIAMLDIACIGMGGVRA